MSANNSMLRRWATGSARLNPLAVYAAAYAAAAAAQKGIGFVLVFWLARQLPVDGYAQFGLLFALQSGVAMLAGAGILDAVVGLLRDHRDPGARAGLFGEANGVLLQLGALTIVVASIVYATLLGDAAAGPMGLLSVLASGALLAWFTHQATMIRLDERHRESMLLLVAGPIAGFAGAFGAFLAAGTVVSFFVGMATGLLACALLLGAARVGSYGISAGLAPTAAIRRRLPPYLLIALLAWLGGYGNTYIVNLLFVPADVARFTFLFTISSVMHLVATSTNQVWSPRFFRLVHELERADIEARNARFFLLQGLALGATGALVLIALPPALEAFGGNLSEYRGLHLELFLLLAGYALSVPWWHGQNYFLAFSEGSTLMRAVVGSSIVGLIAWILLMIALGGIGIYIGFALQMALRSIWVIAIAARRWDVRPAWGGIGIALLLPGTALVIAMSIYPSAH